MDIYSVFMLTDTILALLLLTSKKNEKRTVLNKKIFCVLSGFLLFLIGALKSTSVGVDSNQYSETFYHIQRFDFIDLIDLYDEEWGFYMLMKVISFITPNHQIMFITVSAIFALSISVFIYKYSKNALVSFIIMIAMSYYAFSLSGLRQTVAISILLFSIDFIINRRLFLFLLTVFIASFFHVSSLLFIPAYFLTSKELGLKRIITYFMITPVVFYLRPFFIDIIQLFLYSEYEVDLEQSSGGWTTLFVFILIILTALFLKTQLSKQNSNFSLFFSMMYFGMLLQMFVPLQPNVFRVSMYYNVATMVLIPGIMFTQKDFLSKIITYAVFFIFMGIRYYVFSFYDANANPYLFFWE